MAQADKDFKAKAYDAATTGYTAALEVKPGEKHPTDRLAEIRSLLQAQAAADSLKAAKDAAERERLAEEARRKAEADSLKAAQEAAERERLDAERRSKAEAEAALQARYDDAILKADAAFRNQAYELAREGYNEALAVKPAEQYPVGQLAAIEKALADRSKAEQDAAAAAEAERLAEQERQRKLAEQADADRAALDRARQEREAKQALDERYNGVIRQADEALASKTYTAARDLYAQALDIKPDETYPQVKIGQIDQLLAEQERQRNERELAARQVEKKPPPAASSGLDNRKEQEAEEFMREAREREEAEKYLRIKRQMTAREEQALARTEMADDRQRRSAERNAGQQAANASLYQGSEAARKRNAEELEAFRNAMAERRKTWTARGLDESRAARQQVENMEADFRQQDVSLRAQQQQQDEQVQARKNQWLAGLGRMADAGMSRSEAAQSEVDRQAGSSGARQQELNALAQSGSRQVEQAKERQQAQERRSAAEGMQRTQGQYDRLGSITPNEGRSYDDYARSELASQYPQGVTEESYTEGNKVIIKRVVVQGNKADEYNKVIAKWGTFYFKNGQSISEYIWTLNTGR